MSGFDNDDLALETDKISPIDDVYVDLTVMLGETSMPIHELLRLGRGAVIPLDTTEDDDVRVFVHEMEVAGGQLRLNGEQIEVAITHAKMRAAAHRPPSDPFKAKQLQVADETGADDFQEI